MTKTFALLLILAVVTYSQNCESCKPATKIATCTDYHCYRCEINEVLNLDSLTCDCVDGYYRVNGQCGQCPDGYVYDQITQWCTGFNPCAANQILVNGVCVCQPGLVVIQNICQRCPENQTYYPQYDSCRCSPLYSSINGTCILVTCEARQVYSQTQQKCVCDFGYYLINGVCDRCKNSEIYNSANQSCSPITAPACDFNEYWYQCCCFCQNGYVRIGGKCSKCPEHSSYDWNLNACVCDEGYYFVGEEVKSLPYQTQDTGSSYTSNPGNVYSAYGPSWGSGGQSAFITQFSNYDASGLNIRGPNVNNAYVVVGQRGN